MQAENSWNKKKSLKQLQDAYIDTLHTGRSRDRNRQWGKQIHIKKSPFRDCHRDMWHKMLNHEGLQVKQNTKAADALRCDRQSDSNKVGYYWGIDRHTCRDARWDWQMPRGSDLQRSIWEAVWWVTCWVDPRRRWHSRSLKRLQDVVLLLLLYGWNQTEGGRLVRARLG